MTIEKELRISQDDIKWVVLKCNCGAEQHFDTTSDKQIQTLYSGSISKCWVCEKEYDSGLLKALQTLGKFFKEIKESKREAFFHIAMNDKEKENKQ